MRDAGLHLIKLAAGCESPEQLAAWQAERRWRFGRVFHRTRMMPRRRAELLAGGSIYWVIKGVIQCRQRVLRMDEYIGQDGISRCAIVLDPELIRTQTSLKRPFQGWRYLPVGDAPPDLPKGRAAEESLPMELNRALAEIGVL